MRPSLRRQSISFDKSELAAKRRRRNLGDVPYVRSIARTCFLIFLMMLSCVRGLTLAVTIAAISSSNVASACDSDCLHNQALQFVNDFRGSQGTGPLGSGPNSMLRNAMMHSEQMFSGAQSFSHQDLGAATEKVGCYTFISGENIAFYSGGSPADGPRRCVDMWIDSPGHRANLLRDNDFTAIGVYGVAGGDVYCTQTFGKDRGSDRSAGSGNCDIVPAGGGGENQSPAITLATSAPTRQQTTTTPRGMQQETTTKAKLQQTSTQAKRERTTTTLAPTQKATTNTIRPRPTTVASVAEDSPKETTPTQQCTLSGRRCGDASKYHKTVPKKALNPRYSASAMLQKFWI